MIDGLLLIVITAGMGLSGAYLRAECRRSRRSKAAERKKVLVQIELHSAQLRLGKTDERDWMQSKTTGSFKLSGACRLLAAFFASAMLTGCHPAGGNFLSGGCLVCGAPAEANLQGTLSGLIGSRLQLQNNGVGGFQFNGEVANGKAVVFATAPYNTAYAVTVQIQPTNPSQTCVVANGTGTAGTSDVTNIAVTCTTNPPRFVYVVNRGSNNVSGYSVDATRGTLTALMASPFAVGSLPVAIAVDPTGSYAYIANQADATVSAYTIDRSSGVLTAVKGSPFATGSEPTSVAIDPSSTFVYVTNGGANTVSAYTITPVSGALTPVIGSPFKTGDAPAAAAVDPLGSAVYVANHSDGTVSAFSLDDGALMPVSGSPFAAGDGPAALISDPSGQYLYIADAAANALWGLAGGVEIPDSPYITGGVPASVAVDPSDRFVYVANQGANDISAFALNATTGALTTLAGSPFPTGTQPSSVAVDPTGAFTYVANRGADTVSVYAIDATTGALTAISGSVVATGTQPSAIAISD
jgi:6-phosphogluconolactonase